MPFYNPKDRQAKDLVPGMHIRTFWGEQQLLSLVELDANTVLPRHSHPHEQVGYVVDGEIDVLMEGHAAVRLRKGGSYYVPANVKHHIVTHTPTVLLDAFTPVRDDFLQSRHE
ncbi:MAG: cupin domain-containing protein [Anaerolineales bacterium]|nr:cupin domain-containing protein [Anaerolineales bacterium]